MPRYEYECSKCGTFEVTQKISDSPLSHHTCGAPAERRISQTAFSLKGSGWYSDGYSGSGAPASSSSSGGGESCAAAGGCCGGACHN